MWVGAPIFETVFQWPGFGRALITAINAFDTPVIVGEAVIYGYLLAITIFLLDFVYALVDPRVKVGGAKVERASCRISRPTRHRTNGGTSMPHSAADSASFPRGFIWGRRPLPTR